MESSIEGQKDKKSEIITIFPVNVHRNYKLENCPFPHNLYDVFRSGYGMEHSLATSNLGL